MNPQNRLKVTFAGKAMKIDPNTTNPVNHQVADPIISITSIAVYPVIIHCCLKPPGFSYIP
jgi:hypothetical protein